MKSMVFYKLMLSLYTINLLFCVLPIQVNIHLYTVTELLLQQHIFI